jgi:hypothetical protein
VSHSARPPTFWADSALTHFLGKYNNIFLKSFAPSLFFVAFLQIAWLKWIVNHETGDDLSKYAKLEKFLLGLPGRSWTAEFDEIEYILGFALPPSARKHQAWWVNDKHGHSHAASWLDAGWRTTAIDLRARLVTFVKAGDSAKTARTRSPPAARSHAESPSSVHSSLNASPHAETVALISCGKKKANAPTLAKDLYLSPRFRTARAIPETRGWGWYVLSALYGLVAPDQTIAPYDLTLMEAGRTHRRNWAAKVLQQIENNVEPGTQIVMLAGRDYTEFLAEALREKGYIVDEPLAGLRQGEQRAKLRQMAAGATASDSQHLSKPSQRRDGNGLQAPLHDELYIDAERAGHVAQTLYAAFAPGGAGIFGEHAMPEDILPDGLVPGSREHLSFLTLTISIDYRRDAMELWRAARGAWANKDTRYLFDPTVAAQTASDKLKADLKRTGVLRQDRDGNAWAAICRTLTHKWNSDVKVFLADCGFHGPTILTRLHRDGAWSASSWTPDFPLLRGPKIGPLWVRTLRDNALLELSGLEDVPIPVDVHVMRATLCSGAIRGRYVGSQEPLKKAVRELWRVATNGLRHPDEKPMIPLDVDEPLWTLSRLGCSRRGNGPLASCPPDCVLAPECVEGRIKITDTECDIEIPV